MSIVETILVVFLVLIIIFSVGNWRYWGGYKDGFEEGLKAGKKIILREIETLNEGGYFQKILDDNLDKNPGFVSLMSNLESLVIASRKVWDEHGSSGDDLDVALERFSKTVKYENEPNKASSL